MHIKKRHIYIRPKMDYSVNLEFGTMHEKTSIIFNDDDVIVLNKNEYKIENEE